MIWHFIWRNLTDIKWSDTPFNVTVESLIRPPVFWSKFVRLCLFVGTGPDEGWRGQDQIWLRSAFGGHAERLPYVGRIGRRLSQPFWFFWFSSLSPPLQNHIPPPHVPQKPACPPLCSFLWLGVCARVRVLFHVEGKEKDVLYSLLLVASYQRTLDPLRGRRSCMWVWVYCLYEWGIFLAHFFLSVFTWFLCVAVLLFLKRTVWLMYCNSWTICTEEYWI